MKKLALLALSSFMCATAMANVTFTPVKAPAEIPATRGDEGGYEMKFCGNMASWYQLASTKHTFMAYIYITPQMADRLAGNRMTSLTFSVASKSSSPAELNGKVFVAEDIEDEPVTYSEFKVTPCSTSASADKVLTTASFSDPYTIKAGQGFYYGYILEGCNSYTLPFACDNSVANACAGVVAAFYTNGNMMGEANLATDLGHNLYMTAQTEGDVTSLDDYGFISALSWPDFSLPVIALDAKQNKVSFQISNMGDNKITSMDYAVYLEGQEPEIKTANLNILKLSTMSSSLAVPTLQEGYNIVNFHVYKINGVDCDSKMQVGAIKLNADDFVSRNCVVEKATGTWCGYCPLGIVGFETMEETYPDTFFGIDLHTGDEFDVAEEYEGDDVAAFISAFSGGGVPSFIMNRDMNVTGSPSGSVLKSKYKSFENSCPGVATLTAKGARSEDQKAFAIDVTTTFQYDDPNANYSLAFVVLENGLTGKQTNYYAGQSAAPGDWGSKTNPTAWTYSHTARSYTGFYGLPNSIPAQVTKGTDYNYYGWIDASAVTDIDNAYVLVLLLDNLSGVVMNATRLTSPELSGVENIAVDESGAPVEYYNLQGMRINAPAAGSLVIRRQGDKATKYIVR